MLEAKHFDMPNLSRAVDDGKRILFTRLDPAATPWIREAVAEAREGLESHENRLQDDDGRGTTIKKDVMFDDGRTRSVWVHVFRHDSNVNAEQVRMFMRIGNFEKEWSDAAEASELRKRALKHNAMLRYLFAPEGEPGKTELERDFDAIDVALRAAGVTVSVSTMPCSAEEVLEPYHRPGTFETCFLGGREEPETALLFGHRTPALTGRFLVGFLALSIRNELLRRVRKAFSESRWLDAFAGDSSAAGKPEKPQAAEVIFAEIRNVLDSIEVVFSGSDARCGRVTDAQKAVAEQLDCPGGIRRHFFLLSDSFSESFPVDRMSFTDRYSVYGLLEKSRKIPSYRQILWRTLTGILSCFRIFVEFGIDSSDRVPNRGLRILNSAIIRAHSFSGSAPCDDAFSVPKRPRRLAAPFPRCAVHRP